MLVVRRGPDDGVGDAVLPLSRHGSAPLSPRHRGPHIRLEHPHLLCRRLLGAPLQRATLLFCTPVHPYQGIKPQLLC